MRMNEKQVRIVPALNGEQKLSLYEEVQQLWTKREPNPDHWNDV